MTGCVDILSVSRRSNNWSRWLEPCMGCCQGQLRGHSRLDYRQHIQNGWTREGLLQMSWVVVWEKEEAQG